MASTAGDDAHRVVSLTENDRPVNTIIHSLKVSTPKIRINQTFLDLTNYIEKNINIYNIK
jgi:hypothetical protein